MNIYLFIGCKLHEGRTLLVLFSTSWFMCSEHRSNLLAPALQHTGHYGRQQK